MLCISVNAMLVILCVIANVIDMYFFRCHCNLKLKLVKIQSTQGSYRSWKSGKFMDFELNISGPGKVLELLFCIRSLGILNESFADCYTVRTGKSLD